ncbi:GCN5-like N-acetyltransferase [Planococcus antarcticus DSM 14505]|uniref:GCN5-like N-acetyltransferase n=1 Tax=Planococcus antarcticus DSM 14505 TaxID=1185653 RepID=A0A1C7DDG0_9BACL|nr:GNAT family N-acetyltransferase [Planococcus antarcticus]ANU09559.1 GNAT family N-acetyltransferase [Planococcus antarcticus DSM 14505]EIM08238.1 GCN5-like N-acetyltransferase [Planococcus antarcticus DSM 14505]
MLTRYKRSNEKIAMGLLSFMPKERNFKQLKKTMELYNEQADWQLFLWKVGDSYVGAIGIHIEDAESFTVHHISVIPSFRREGIGHKMVMRVEGLMAHRRAKPTEETQTFMMKCGV